jgi:hypothetical protein
MSGYTRRAVLGATGAGVAGAAVGVGATYAVMRDDGDAAAAGGGAPEEEPLPPRHHYRSTQLAAPTVEVSVEDEAALAPGLLLLGPRREIFRGVLLRNDGEPVWIEPDGNNATDLRVQQWQGRPVLTYWTGLSPVGVGEGYGVILDETYTRVATVQTGHGCISDLHEFKLTDAGTALMLAYRAQAADLSSVGGPEDGWVWTNIVQEIDVESGEVLVEWNCTDDLAVDETYEDVGEDGASADRPFDAFHFNSVEERDDVLLVSARHTHALYAIDRRTGELEWRLGGKQSDFEVPEDAAFLWQHDARFHPDGVISMFDNHGSVGEEDVESQALLLTVDEEARTVETSLAITLDGRFGGAMGNTEVLENGNVLVGWGTGRGVSEHAADGTLLYDMTFEGFGSYRAYRVQWEGRPAQDPDIAVDAADGGLTVFASWNGATGVDRWRVVGGGDGGEELATAPAEGFETEIAVDGSASTVRVEALDGSGRVLGRSREVRV